jgi:GntR family transcriptional regulator, vanillate catabolism transcriptional regulator
MAELSVSHRIKQMILHEELKPGERLTEAAIAARLQVSRTPVRNALPALAAEGLLEPVGRRGYRVSLFGELESWQALELRGLLEGHAASLLASRGADDQVMAALEACLVEGDRLFEKRYLDAEDEQHYGEMNGRFHRIILEASALPLLQSMIERLNQVPFVAPAVIMFDEVGLSRAFEYLFRAHGVHHAIVEAIREGDGYRAETLFREHARQQRFSMFSRRSRQAVQLDDTGKMRKSRNPRNTSS